MSRLKRLIVEAHQRSLWQALLIYLGASFAGLEAADLLIERFGLPGWLFPVAFALLLVGLPVVIVTALAKEEVYGDEVPAEHAAAAAEEDRRLRLFTWRTAGLSFVGALALWGLVVAGLLLVGGYGLRPPDERQSVAVLPFENLSPDPSDSYFTDGIHDEIISRLGKIGALRVISRTSVMEYRGQARSLGQIADELGVTKIVEGTVRRAEDRVRITAQLIDARTDAHIWAESYERQLLDVFSIQSDVARQIALALQTELTPEELARIEARPTGNLDAYQAYLRGRYFMHLPHFTAENLNRALQEFQRAVELDSTFALAHAELALAHAQQVYYWVDASGRQRDLATRAVQQAVRVGPESPNVRLALGLYHLWLHRDPERALEEIARAEEGLPHSQSVLEARAAVYELQGRFEEGIDVYLKTLEISPRDASIHTSLAFYSWLIRRYDQAEAFADQAITLAPDQLWPSLCKVLVIWSDRGANEETEAILEALPHDATWVRWARYWQRMLQDRYVEAIEPLSEGDFEWIRLKMWARPNALLAALAYRAMDRPDQANRLFEEARLALERELETQPEDPRYHSSLGLAYAGLGQTERAVREGERAVELLPLSTDAFYGLPYLLDLAAIYAMVGDENAAVNEIEKLLAVPSWLSPTWLDGDFRIDPLRDHPRFQALLEKYE
jgi:TolB-like protein/Flp pilus assembly protein TadD